ncbi:MAG TPA: DUF2079 domain-containing protein [Acidimicrobiia bacterium]|nr:DUF2079 domain-containing protein [Acidimicrobiia bacterium]
MTAATTTLEPAAAAARTPEASPAAPRRRFRCTVPGLVLALPAVLITLTAVARYLFGRGAIDLVVFDQALWLASRGVEPMVSVIGESLLEDHFGLGIFVFAPLYRIFASPLWLIVAQGVAAWAAVRLIVRRLESSLGALQAAFVGAALLVSPPVAYALLFDFHSVVLAVPFALAGFFALEDGRPRAALLFGLLATLFRVEVGAAVAIAFLVWPGPRRGRLQASVGLWAYLVVAFYFEKALGHDVYWAIHYGHLGPSMGAALADPFRAAGALLSADSVAKAFPWLASGAFLAFRSPRRAIPAVLVALPVLLSRWDGTGSIVFHYGFAPTLLVAAAWIPALQRRPGRSRHVIAACGLLALLFGPLLPAFATDDPLGTFAGRYWTPRPGVRCLAGGIPADAGVSARTGLTFLAHRARVYLWPYPFQGAPADVLPADYLAYGDPHKAAGVDYLIIPRHDIALVPPGFVPDGESVSSLRFRREATTAPSPVDCR